MAKVLVVEDDNNLREIYETSLKAEGYDTLSAADGMEALEIASRDKPDLIISDVMMPRLSGFEMLEKLRQDQNLKDIPVIMMTALSMAEDKDTAKRLGVVHYLVKSQVTLEDFVNVAKKFVAVDGSSASPATPTPSEPVVEAPTAEPTPAPAPAPAEPVSATQPAEPNPQPAPEPAPTPAPAPAPAEPTAPVNVPASAQSTSDEASAVSQQIEDFVATAQPDTTPPADNAQPAPPAEPANDADSNASETASKKVIEPIVDPNKKDIHELAKAEEAKEQADKPVSNPSAGSSIDPNSVAL